MLGRDRYDFGLRGFRGAFRGWGFQDFTAALGNQIGSTTVTLSDNTNGTDINAFESASVISNTAVICVLTAGVPTAKKPRTQTGAAGLFTKAVTVSAHTGASVTLSGVPHSSFDCRIYYFYSYQWGAPLDYSIPSKAVASGLFAELQDLLVTEEEIGDGSKDAVFKTLKNTPIGGTMPAAGAFTSVWAGAIKIAGSTISGHDIIIDADDNLHLSSGDGASVWIGEGLDYLAVKAKEISRVKKIEFGDYGPCYIDFPGSDDLTVYASDELVLEGYTIKLKGRVRPYGHIYPDTNDTYDLGRLDYGWHNIYLDGEILPATSVEGGGGGGVPVTYGSLLNVVNWVDQNLTETASPTFASLTMDDEIRFDLELGDEKGLLWYYNDSLISYLRGKADGDVVINAQTDIELRSGYDIELYASDDIVISAADEVRVKSSGEEDDYILFQTVSDVPEITTAGSCNLKITASGGTIDHDDDHVKTTGNLTDGTYSLTIANAKDAYDKRVTTWTAPLALSAGTASISYSPQFALRPPSNTVLWLVQDQIDHGLIGGLDHNDHGAIYYTETEVDTFISNLVDGTTAFTGIDVNGGALDGVALGATCTQAEWDAAYSHISNNGSDHSYIGQDVTATGTPTFGTVNTAELFNSGGDLKIEPDVQGDVVLFGDTDVDDAATSKSLYIHRKAVEGDDYLRFYLAANGRPQIYGTDTMTFESAQTFYIVTGVNAAVKLGDAAGAREFEICDSGWNIKSSIDSDGNAMFLGSYTQAIGGTNTPLYIDNAGLIGPDPSALRFKKNIRDLGGSEAIYQLRPVLYDRKDGSAKDKVGLIAEEVATVMPDSVVFERDITWELDGEVNRVKSVQSTGVPFAVNYSSLIVPMLKEMQKLKTEVNALRRRN